MVMLYSEIGTNAGWIDGWGLVCMCLIVLRGKQQLEEFMSISREECVCSGER